MTGADGGTDAGEELRLHGVSLRQLAAVNAALAEPFALRQVLAVEEIDYQAFRRADVAWKLRLAPGHDGGDPQTPGPAGKDALFAAYRRELALAEDWLLRVVSPLHQDVEAYVTFLGAFGRAPAEILRAHDLGLNDVSRLARFWASQRARDSALESRFTALMKRGPGAWPPLTADPRKLRRSRAFQPVHGDAAPIATPSPDRPRDEAESSGLEQYAALRAELQAAPADAPRILRRHGLADAGAAQAQDRLWEARFAASPALQRDYRALLAHFERVAHHGGAPAAPEPSSRVPAAITAPPAPVPIAAPARTVISEGELGAGPALPFGPVAPPAPEEAGETAVFSAPLMAEALPFGKRARARRNAPAVANPLGETFDIEAKPTGPVLPFSGRAPARVYVPSAPNPLGETFDVEAKPTGPALPFTRRAGVPPGAPSSAEIPGAPVSIAPVSTAPPSTATEASADGGLRLEQYASLCVELRARPDRAAETLARYQLTAESSAAVDAWWKRRLAGDPALHAAFQRAYEAYEAWLAAPPSARTSAPASVAAEVPSFSVEQYASLVIDLAAAPAHRAATLLRYRLTEAQRAAVEAGWTARFAREPEALLGFQQACAAYSAWLAQRAR